MTGSSLSSYRSPEEWIEYYREKGVDVVKAAMVRCPRCVEDGEDGRPVLTQGTKGMVRYHECPRCTMPSGGRYRFVSVEVTAEVVAGVEVSS